MNEPLSEREIEILQLAADGCSNGEIAARLSLSLNTIKWYSKRIYEKLDVETRTQAIKRAQTMGLFNGGTPQSKPIQPGDNLPSPLTAFVGRHAEIDTIKQLLKQHRLLTLTGPGGIGKTRLALQVAEELQAFFRNGVYFVDLATINETNLVINTIAHALGVAESLDTPLTTLMQAHLRDKQLLLVLDNFEHLIAAAPVVADLLTAARELTVLLTSREVLALYGEQEYAVPPLQLPDLEWFAAPHISPGDLLNSESLQLFERCAQAVDPAFRLTAENAAAVASLCLRLDGLPLAIELAAAYVKLLSPQAMLTQLDALWLEMKRTVRNIPARQQTLRNTIEWSYRFLNEEERRLFAQLAVFRGGCTAEAIHAICANHPQGTMNGAWTGALLETLNGLVNKSLVWRRVDQNDQPRFGML
ncbi:MAG TPA: LuxR C-terminal-related transcriptional regulator, partial [Caldilineaceae bacterium]|nr:LuxR C-terminal-related transcriptional regulator [Caldilineaceae bacterium]